MLVHGMPFARFVVPSTGSRYQRCLSPGASPYSSPDEAVRRERGTHPTADVLLDEPVDVGHQVGGVRLRRDGADRVFAGERDDLVRDPVRQGLCARCHLGLGRLARGLGPPVALGGGQRGADRRQVVRGDRVGTEPCGPQRGLGVVDRPHGDLQVELVRRPHRPRGQERDVEVERGRGQLDQVGGRRGQERLPRQPDVGVRQDRAHRVHRLGRPAPGDRHVCLRSRRRWTRRPRRPRGRSGRRAAPTDSRPAVRARRRAVGCGRVRCRAARGRTRTTSDTCRASPHSRPRVSSCSSTATPSAVRRTSTSIVSAPSASATATAGRVFSRRTRGAPRWATRRGTRPGPPACGGVGDREQVSVVIGGPPAVRRRGRPGPSRAGRRWCCRQPAAHR